jgi:hypothetical protein
MSAVERAWTGPYRSYDLVKEFVVALVGVTLLSVGLAVVLSSPDESPVTIRSWARADPKDFVVTAMSELTRTSEVAQYGAPYTHTPDAAQTVGPIDLQSVPGVRIPIDTARMFVLDPLRIQAGDDPAVRSALAEYGSASAPQRAAWADAFTKALDAGSVSGGGISVASAEGGPLPAMMGGLLSMARDGALDGALLAGRQFYQTDYTKPVLFLSGGSYFEDRASAQHLLGEQWGMMNETGNYPGQPWLWLYTFWYEVPPFRDSGNADAEIWVIMMLLTAALVLLPFIPGLRAIPEKLRVYRWIWREHYREVEAPGVAASPRRP